MKKLLIANRGEIAVRILRTCKRLGIKTVAVFSRFDRESPHVDLADESYLLDGETPAETYLDVSKLIQIAKSSGAEGVHPGYGFLSESAEFSEATEKAGLIFIGPTARTLTLAGNKDAARRLAASLGIPTPRGYDEKDQQATVLLQAAKQIGLPLLVKAVAGGGGRGMRLVRDEQELAGALTSAATEAKKFFGDGRLILEQYLRPVRHIEVQLVGDGKRFWHLHERDCSLQRRYQKLIEESPARGLLPAVRDAIFAAALKLAAAIELKGVATAEFLVREDQAKTDPYFFLEINPRIQVEHPVTECVTGIDIVELQLKIANGEALRLKQEEIKIHGHAIEARVCAELPAFDFRPSTGSLRRLEIPSHPDLRFEHALKNNLEINSQYDSLILKAIAWGETAEAARESLSYALKNLTLGGIDTNIWFLRSILDSEVYRGTEPPDTAYLDSHLAEFNAPPQAESLAFAKRALAGHLGSMFLTPDFEPRSYSIPELSFEVRSSALDKKWMFPVRPKRSQNTEDPDEHELSFVLGQQEEVVTSSIAHPERHELRGVGESLCVSMSGPDLWMKTSIQSVEHFEFRVSRPANWVVGVDESENQDSILAPLPGTAVSLRASVGTHVKKGDVVLVIESMKMEHSVRSPRDGIIKEVHTTVGSKVQQHQLVVVLE